MSLLGAVLVGFKCIHIELYRSLNRPLCGSLSVYFNGYLLPCNVIYILGICFINTPIIVPHYMEKSPKFIADIQGMFGKIEDYTGVTNIGPNKTGTGRACCLLCLENEACSLHLVQVSQKLVLSEPGNLTHYRNEELFRNLVVPLLFKARVLIKLHLNWRGNEWS